jgi:hypothetical protein
VGYCARSVRCGRQPVFCIGVSELSAEKEDLSGIIYPDDDYNDGPCGPICGSDTRFTQIFAGTLSKSKKINLHKREAKPAWQTGTPTRAGVGSGKLYERYVALGPSRVN